MMTTVGKSFSDGCAVSREIACKQTERQAQHNGQRYIVFRVVHMDLSCERDGRVSAQCAANMVFESGHVTSNHGFTESSCQPAVDTVLGTAVDTVIDILRDIAYRPAD